MFISIIVPVYNGEKYLLDNYASLESQTYKNFEILYVNDGSDDMSLEILNGLQQKDKKIRVITQDNQGIDRAVQTAINEARSDYIVWIDQDDIADSNRLQLTKQAFESGAQLIMGKYHIINDDLTETDRIVSIPEAVRGDKFLLELLKRNYFLGSAMAFKRYPNQKILIGVQGVTDYFIALDYISQSRKFQYIDEVLIKYRVHQNNFSSNYVQTKKNANVIFTYLEQQMLKILEQNQKINTSELNLAFVILALFREDIQKAKQLCTQVNYLDLEDREKGEYFFYQAVICLEQSDIQQALQYLIMAKKYISNPAIVNNIGYCEFQLKNFDVASERFKMAISLNDAYQDARNNYNLFNRENLKYTKRLLRETLIHSVNIKE